MEEGVGFYVNISQTENGQSELKNQTKDEISSSSNSYSREKLMEYFCFHCPHKFLSKSLLRKHMLKHLRHKSFRCIECGRGFSVKQDYDEHLLKHSTSSFLKCAGCVSKYYSDLHGLENHTLKCHTKTGSFNCSLCEFTAKTYHTLYTHKLVHKKPREVFSCSRCKLEFSTQSQLYQHQILQSHEKLECLICVKTFITQTNRINHMREHHGKIVKF